VARDGYSCKVEKSRLKGEALGWGKWRTEWVVMIWCQMGTCEWQFSKVMWTVQTVHRQRTVVTSWGPWFPIGGQWWPHILSCTVMEMCGLKILESRCWPSKVTWHHQSHDHWIGLPQIPYPKTRVLKVDPMLGCWDISIWRCGTIGCESPWLTKNNVRDNKDYATLIWAKIQLKTYQRPSKP